MLLKVSICFSLNSSTVKSVVGLKHMFFLFFFRAFGDSMVYQRMFGMNWLSQFTCPCRRPCRRPCAVRLKQH